MGKGYPPGSWLSAAGVGRIRGTAKSRGPHNPAASAAAISPLSPLPPVFTTQPPRPGGAPLPAVTELMLPHPRWAPCPRPDSHTVTLTVTRVPSTHPRDPQAYCIAGSPLPDTDGPKHSPLGCQPAPTTSPHAVTATDTPRLFRSLSWDPREGSSQENPPYKRPPPLPDRPPMSVPRPESAGLQEG